MKLYLSTEGSSKFNSIKLARARGSSWLYLLLDFDIAEAFIHFPVVCPERFFQGPKR